MVQPGAIRGAIEKDMHTMEGHDGWRCIAVIKDPKNTARIRVTCRDEAELQHVKAAAQKTSAPGARVLRDQLYPVKVDNANRTVILSQDGTIRPEAAEALGMENNTRIAKIAWLSKKDTGKAYGSMVVYVIKGRCSTIAARTILSRCRRISLYQSLRTTNWPDTMLQMSSNWTQGILMHKTADLCKMRSRRSPPPGLPRKGTKVCTMWRTT